MLQLVVLRDEVLGAGQHAADPKHLLRLPELLVAVGHVLQQNKI